MKTLAIDTSSSILSVCICNDTHILGEYTIDNPCTHSSKIIPIIDSLITNLELSINDIDLFGICIGPGSFTGIRIGMGIAKSMAQASEKPIIGINSLQSLAHNVSNISSLICPMIDAKNDNIYTCIFDDKYNLILDYACLNIDDLLKICAKQKKSIFFIGNGSLAHKEKILKTIKQKKIAGITDSYLTAKNIALLANSSFNCENTNSVFDISPMYLRATMPERLMKNE